MQKSPYSPGQGSGSLLTRGESSGCRQKKSLLFAGKVVGEMKVTVLIKGEAVVRKILEHLDLWRVRRGDELGTAPQESVFVEPAQVYDPADDGWPGWDEDAIDELFPVAFHCPEKSGTRVRSD